MNLEVRPNLPRLKIKNILHWKKRKVTKQHQ
jgi:hypothetical protein